VEGGDWSGHPPTLFLTRRIWHKKIDENPRRRRGDYEEETAGGPKESAKKYLDPLSGQGLEKLKFFIPPEPIWYHDIVEGWTGTFPRLQSVVYGESHRRKNVQNVAHKKDSKYSPRVP